MLVTVDMDFVRKRLEKYGVDPKDAGAVLAVYGVLDATMFVGGWCICYRYKPLTTLVRSAYVQRMANRYPKIRDKIVSFKNGLEERMTRSDTVDRFCRIVSVNKRKAIGSLIEITVFHRVVSPITTPVGILVAWGFVKWLKIKESVESFAHNLSSQDASQDRLSSPEASETPLSKQTAL